MSWNSVVMAEWSPRIDVIAAPAYSRAAGLGLTCTKTGSPYRAATQFAHKRAVRPFPFANGKILTHSPCAIAISRRMEVGIG